MMFVKISENKVVNLAQVVYVEGVYVHNINGESWEIEEPYREQFETALRRVNEAVIFAAK